MKVDLILPFGKRVRLYLSITVIGALLNQN